MSALDPPLFERMTELRARTEGARQLSLFIIATFTAYCAKCGDVEEASTSSSFDAALKFYITGGWRVVNEQPLCGDCVRNQPTPKEKPMLQALVVLLNSGINLAPEVIALINAVRQQPGMSDTDILAHAAATNSAAGQAIVTERLRLLDEIAAQGGAE